MGTHCHQVLAFSTTTLAGELQLLPPASVWLEADHDHAWTATVFMALRMIHAQRKQTVPSKTKIQCHQHCCETSPRTNSILPFSLNKQLQVLAGHNRKQKEKGKERPCNLRKASTSLAVYYHRSQHAWRRGGANSVRVKPSFSGTANLRFTDRASSNSQQPEPLYLAHASLFISRHPFIHSFIHMGEKGPTNEPCATGKQLKSDTAWRLTF